MVGVGWNIPANKENVNPHLIMIEEQKIHYLDVCFVLSNKLLAMNSLNNTRTTIFDQPPALLAKLLNVENSCTKKIKQ